MDYYFHQKFNHLIKSKKNRQNICDMIKDHFHNKKSEIYMCFYELYCEYQLQPNKEHLYEFLKQKKFLYENDIFQDISEMIQEEENFIVSPPKLSEGIMVCKFCKSRKTISYERQTRSADEQSTIFVKCMDCSKSFRM